MVIFKNKDFLKISDRTFKQLGKKTSTWFFWPLSVTTKSKAGKLNVSTDISVFVLPSAHRSQTNPSSFMTHWGLLLLLIHGGIAIKPIHTTQPISTVPMNIWTGPSTSLSLPRQQLAALIDDKPVLWRKEEENVRIVCSVPGRKGHRYFHSRALCWLIFTLCWIKWTKSVFGQWWRSKLLSVSYIGSSEWGNKGVTLDSLAVVQWWPTICHWEPAVCRFAFPTDHLIDLLMNSLPLLERVLRLLL